MNRRKQTKKRNLSNEERKKKGNPQTQTKTKITTTKQTTPVIQKKHNQSEK